MASGSKSVRVFGSFAEAAQADRDYYAALSPEERLAIVFELVAEAGEGSTGEDAEGLARVYRIVERQRS